MKPLLCTPRTGGSPVPMLGVLGTASSPRSGPCVPTPGLVSPLSSIRDGERNVFWGCTPACSAPTSMRAQPHGAITLSTPCVPPGWSLGCSQPVGIFWHGCRPRGAGGSCREAAAPGEQSGPGREDAPRRTQPSGCLAPPTPRGDRGVKNKSVSFLTPYFRPRDK